MEVRMYLHLIVGSLYSIDSHLYTGLFSRKLSFNKASQSNFAFLMDASLLLNNYYNQSIKSLKATFYNN
jgi:hypothetical protein